MKAHFVGKLHPQMAEASQPLNGHQIARSGSAVPQAVECGDPGTENRRRFRRRQQVGNGRQRFRTRNQVLGISSILMKAGHEELLTSEQITAMTRGTVATMPAVPSHPNPLAFLPSHHSGTDGINHSCDLMTRDTRILKSRPMAFFHKHVTMANPTGLDFYTDRVWLRLRHRTPDDLERTSRRGDLHGCHDCHHNLLRWLVNEHFVDETSGFLALWLNADLVPCR